MRLLPPLLCAAALGLAPQAFASTSTIVQITVDAAVEQVVNYRGPTPNYYDSNPYAESAYPFWNQYQDVMHYGVDVWDKSQIPTTLTASDDDYYDVRSAGTLQATWSFDASLLAQDLTAYTDPEGTNLGTSSLVSSFLLSSLGVQVDQGFMAVSEVWVINDMVLGEDGQTQDVIAIRAANETMSEEGTYYSYVSDGAVLYLAGDSNWFEESAGEIPDLSGIVAAYINYYEEGFLGSLAEDDLAFEMSIEGDLTGSELQVAVYGAADGSSEDSPLLPSAATEGDGTSTGASYTFDLAVAGVDYVYIDPEIAVGYTYEVVGNGVITGIRAPSLDAVADSDGYTITLPDGTTFHLDPGEEVLLSTPVTSFTLSGIDESLMLDPTDQTTFVIALLFSGTDEDSQLVQTALVIDTDLVSPVPLPASLPLLLAGVLGLGVMRRRAGGRQC